MIYQGSCHCGRIAFEVEGDILAAKECNCSICHRLGALRWFTSRDKLRLTTPASDMAIYTFGAGKIKHHFCSVCGCAPFAEAEHKGVPMASINLRCLEGLDLSQVKISQFDGRSL